MSNQVIRFLHETICLRAWSCLCGFLFIDELNANYCITRPCDTITPSTLLAKFLPVIDCRHHEKDFLITRDLSGTGTHTQHALPSQSLLFWLSERIHPTLLYAASITIITLLHGFSSNILNYPPSTPSPFKRTFPLPHLGCDSTHAIRCARSGIESPCSNSSSGCWWPVIAVVVAVT